MASLALVAVGAALLAPRAENSSSAPTIWAETPGDSDPVQPASTSTSELPAPPAPGDLDEDLEHHPEDAPSTYAVASWGEGAATEAVAAAEAVIDAWFSDLPAPQWGRAIAPLLTEPAGQIYGLVDPESIIDGQRTGAGSIPIAPTSSLYVEVSVPTSAGDYTVALLRDADGSDWLAERLRQPERQPGSEATS